MSRASAIAVLAASQQVDLPEEAWLAQVVDPLSDLLGEGMGAVAVAFEPTRHHAEPRSVAAGRDIQMSHVEQYFTETRARAGPGHFRHILDRAYALEYAVNRLSERLTGSSIDVCRGAIHRVLGRRFDFVGLLAADPWGGGVSISSVIDEDAPLPTARRRLLRHLLRRIEVDLGLRHTLALTGRDPLTGADAVVSADGRIEHATPRAQAVIDELVGRARQAERAARDRGRHDLDDTLRAYAGLFDGVWAMLHRYDDEGRRCWVFHRNAPEIAAMRALSSSERAALLLRIYGSWPKDIADQLGVSPSTVHTWLARGRAKLGGVGWVDLADLFRAVPRERALAALTDLADR